MYYDEELAEQGMLVWWRSLPAHVAERLARETGREDVCPLVVVACVSQHLLCFDIGGEEGH
jgi:hypothetical protein